MVDRFTIGKKHCVDNTMAYNIKYKYNCLLYYMFADFNNDNWTCLLYYMLSDFGFFLEVLLALIHGHFLV